LSDCTDASREWSAWRCRGRGCPGTATITAGKFTVATAVSRRPVRRHDHDLTAARDADLLGALYWAASRLHLPTLADGGYQGAGQGIHVPYKQPGGGNNVLAVDHLAYNTLHRAQRALGERGFALLATRWRALQRITASPSRIGDIAAAARMLTQFEQRDLRRSC
jgi:DDE superfamily endonuclease